MSRLQGWATLTPPPSCSLSYLIPNPRFLFQEKCCFSVFLSPRQSWLPHCSASG